MTHGQASYRIGRRTHCVLRNQGIVVPAQHEHATAFDTELDAETFRIPSGMANEVAAAAGFARPMEAIVLKSEVTARLRTLASLLPAKPLGQLDQLLAQTLLESMLLEMLRAAPDRVRRLDARVQRAVEYIHDRYADPIDLNDLARAAAMSRYHFSRKFRAQVGMSPYRYVQHVRMRRAADLLRAGTSVTETACAVGVPDSSRFARLFRREMEMTPSNYQKGTRRV